MSTLSSVLNRAQIRLAGLHALVDTEPEHMVILRAEAVLADERNQLNASRPSSDRLDSDIAARRVEKNPTSHLNLPEDLAGGADVPEGDTMSIPTTAPARPVPTRNSREQCPTCRCFLPVRKTPTACPRCGQPLNSGASTRPRPPKPAERVRLANYEAEIAYRISQDIQAKWQGCVVKFDYTNGIELRAARDDSGEPIVCLADLAHGLGIKNVSQLRNRLPKEVCQTYTLQTAGGPQQMLFVTEAGMNLVIWRSDKPEAIAYAKWCADRIVELRHHGLTATPQTVESMLADPDVMIKALEALKAERARRAELEAQAAADRPKVLFADSVSASRSTVLVGEVAKILKGNGVDIGGTRLFELLRRRGLLISREGSDWNMPTQKAMELGLFQIKETAITHSDGHVSISKTTKVTGKGQQYIVQRVLSGAWNDSIAEVNTA